MSERVFVQIILRVAYTVEKRDMPYFRDDDCRNILFQKT